MDVPERSPRIINLTATGGRPTNYTFDHFVAPEFSQLKECNVVDLSEYDRASDKWISTLLCDSTLRVRLHDPFRALAVMFLRRTQMALREHDNGRLAILEFLATYPKSIRLYYRALYHFEGTLAQAWQAFDILRRWNENGNPTLELVDVPGGAMIKALNTLHNACKHPHGNLQSDVSVTVWLTNEGLKGDKAILPFTELEEILRLLARLADRLSIPSTWCLHDER